MFDKVTQPPPFRQPERWVGNAGGGPDAGALLPDSWLSYRPFNRTRLAVLFYLAGHGYVAGQGMHEEAVWDLAMFVGVSLRTTQAALRVLTACGAVRVDGKRRNRRYWVNLTWRPPCS